MSVLDRYTLKNFLNAMQDPSVFRKEGYRLILGYLNGYRYGEGIDVMSQDWDNLIILDACRHDYFDQVSYFDGRLQPVTSKDKTSWEFIKHNFHDINFHDTIYVTANPSFTDIGQDVFFAIRSTLDEVTSYVKGWKVGIDQVHPQRIVELSRELYNEHPQKRLVIHFMQPHQPFIGEKADEIRDKIPREFYQIVTTTTNQITFLTTSVVNT